MLHPNLNVSNENQSIVISTPDKAKFVDLLKQFIHLNEQYANDIRNTIDVIREIAQNAEPEKEMDSAYRFYRIQSLGNLLSEKINPEQFCELHDFLNSFKI